jgi:alanine dehydrogenase
MKLAKLGANVAIREDQGIAEGVNTFNGFLTYKAVAQAQGRECSSIGQLHP